MCNSRVLLKKGALEYLYRRYNTCNIVVPSATLRRTYTVNIFSFPQDIPRKPRFQDPGDTWFVYRSEEAFVLFQVYCLKHDPIKPED